MFNLIDERWLPARRLQGQTEYIRPAEITTGVGTNPIVAIEWPRADFRIATIEFLIGLTAVAWPPPDDEEGWIEGWENPPSSDALAQAFSLVAHAFDLDGSGPRFLQDFDDLPDEPNSPETLLIEAPGENTRRKNTALLVKPERIRQMARPAAAMALFALQCYAPQGGSGHRTSVRGGGPLTTLVLPTAAPSTLWHVVWANTPRGALPRADELPRVFPWLAPTRTADRFPATTPTEAHPLQALWGMPRRIRLEFAENTEDLTCDLTGTIDTTIVTGWRQRPNGVKYVSWEHPLSPSYKDVKSGGWIAQLAKAGVGYRDWVAITLGDDEGAHRPAAVINTWRSRSSNVDLASQSRLLAAGYNMVNNMKARAFIESELPLPGTSLEAAEAFTKVARRLVEAAGLAASALRSTVKQACFSRDTNRDSAPLAAVYEDFWATTQDDFFRLIRVATKTSESWEAALDSTAPAWHRVLKVTALRLFDQAAPLDASAASFDPRRIVEARRNLFGTLGGRGPMGRRLFEALQLPSLEPKGKQRHPAEAAGSA